LLQSCFLSLTLSAAPSPPSLDTLADVDLGLIIRATVRTLTPLRNSAVGFVQMGRLQIALQPGQSVSILRGYKSRFKRLAGVATKRSALLNVDLEPRAFLRFIVNWSPQPDDRIKNVLAPGCSWLLSALAREMNQQDCSALDAAVLEAS
jgi:hypothetical protein